ncbi:MAG: VOC family protein [Euryarchaeota archaeon]|nr:VOC family protein [Euryarchaeota archaeon]MDE1836002.1 VOC family protein [Euryarchaeota archaeon]MDE1880956.1 VOC family protein [Euryarchaeota archaeon]MDE2046006.1 VOC family protein [Thermoplasmata archaeon]
MPPKKGPTGSMGPWMASVAVMVADRERSKKWYTDKLGFSVLQEEGGHWVTVGRKGRGGAIHLCLGSEIGGLPLEPGNTGILVMVDGDLKTECAKLKERGVEFVHEPTKQPWGVWDAMIRDPDGNEILLMQEE